MSTKKASDPTQDSPECCANCDHKCTDTCNYRHCPAFLSQYFKRQARINAFDRKYGVMPTTDPDADPYPDPAKPNGITLRDARVAVRMTQRQVAQTLHVTPSTVSYWEAGINKPSPEKQEDLALLYQVELANLII